MASLLTHMDASTPEPSLRLRPSPTPSSARLWRPAAQRNLRNQWSKLSSSRQNWVPLSSSGRSSATFLVNSYLSQRYMDAQELGVLSDMLHIRDKASYKLLKQQVMHRAQLLSAYKNMVAALLPMIQSSGNMRCFSQGAKGSTLTQFSNIRVDPNDSGDGDGIPVFTFWSISSFEELAQELVGMFKKELMLKRLLVLGLLSITFGKTGQGDKLSWSDELYPGEADDLSACNMYSKETCSPALLGVKGWSSDTPDLQSDNQPERDILQVYITTWLAEVNIDMYRVDEIFAMAGEEMHVSFS